MNQEELIMIYSGTEITALLLKEDLEQAGIFSIIRNDFLSGVMAGFSGGIPSNVDLYIEEQDLEMAKPIVNQFLTVNQQ